MPSLVKPIAERINQGSREPGLNAGNRPKADIRADRNSGAPLRAQRSPHRRAHPVRRAATVVRAHAGPRGLELGKLALVLLAGVRSYLEQARRLECSCRQIRSECRSTQTGGEP